MDADDIVYVLCENRLNGELNQLLVNDQEYQDAEKEVCRKMERLLKSSLSDKQRDRLDNVASAYNASCVAFGRVTYLQGFKDGYHLALELFSEVKRE